MGDFLFDLRTSLYLVGNVIGARIFGLLTRKAGAKGSPSPQHTRKEPAEEQVGMSMSSNILRDLEDGELSYGEWQNECMESLRMTGWL
jgi:hypothetical protein